MTSGFAGLIGRWFRRHTDESTPAQKGVVVTSPHPDMPGPCRYFGGSGAAVSAPRSSQLLETFEAFEAFVGFDNLCRIARAADNLEAVIGDVIDAYALTIKGDQMALVTGALQELRDALVPYRTAREQARKK